MLNALLLFIVSAHVSFYSIMLDSLSRVCETASLTMHVSLHFNVFTCIVKNTCSQVLHLRLNLCYF